MELTMLILSRKVDEEIILGNDIVIKISQISKGSVKIAIQAPKETLILRGELKDQIQQSNQEAILDTPEKSIKDLSKLLKK